MKKSFNKIYGITILSAATVLLQACGGAPYPEINSLSGATSSGSGGSTTTSGSGNTGTTTTPSTSDPNLLPAYTYTFSNSGVNTSTISGIVTDNKLSVTVSLGQPSNIPGTGYTAAYSCARINVSVAGQTQTVFVTNSGSDMTAANGYSSYHPCFGAVTSSTVDFSNRLTAGHGAMSINLTNVSYDNCRLYGNVYGSGCFMTTVYSTHVVNGSIQVHVNGTN